MQKALVATQGTSSTWKAAAAAAAAAAKSLQSCPTLRPHRQQPTRLRRPWDSPGKNTGVGCHFLLQCMKVKSEREVAQSCLTLSNPMDCSPSGSLPNRECAVWSCASVLSAPPEGSLCTSLKQKPRLFPRTWPHLRFSSWTRTVMRNDTGRASHLRPLPYTHSTKISIFYFVYLGIRKNQKS